MRCRQRSARRTISTSGSRSACRSSPTAGRPMASRTLTFLIVAGWLASTGWFVARDVWPQLRSGEPPPFTIELADEALRQLVPTRWTVRHNGQPVGTVRTTLIYDEKTDSFAM